MMEYLFIQMFFVCIFGCKVNKKKYKKKIKINIGSNTTTVNNNNNNNKAISTADLADFLGYDLGKMKDY